MKTITFPLQSGMKGEAVAGLHEGLRLLLKRQVVQVTGTGAATFDERLNTEVTARAYGESTRALVTLFQQSRGLPSTGIVDEVTAKALNTTLTGLAATELAAAATTGEGLRVVAGQVRRDD